MVKLMAVDQLVKIAACVGILLEPVGNIEDENLYVYATEGEQHIVYVGKNEALIKRARLDVETGLSKVDYKNRTESGFAALIQENNAKRHSFRYHPAAFDPSALRAHIVGENWSGARSIGSWKRSSRGPSPCPSPTSSTSSSAPTCALAA